MDRLTEQLDRLYAPAGEGQVRTLVLAFARCRDWPAVAAVLQGVADDLELPAPALSISAAEGYQVWFVLTEPVPAAVGGRFLAGLQRRFLVDLPAARLAGLPATEGLAPLAGLPRVPALDEASGRWSAFVDPAMGGMFAEAPGLEISPNPERQADLLAGLRGITPAELAGALEKFDALAAAPAQAGGVTGSIAGGPFADPGDFLRAVMNDANAPLALRIEAATALLSARAGKPLG